MTRVSTVLLIGAIMLALAACTTTMRGSANTGDSTTLSAGASPATGLSPADRTITVPDLAGMTGDQAGAALSAAGVLDVRFTQNDAPMTNAVVRQLPRAGAQQRAGAPVHVTLQPPPPVPHRAISARDWQIIAKDPDAHQGERVIIHGTVTQFDAATGTSTFRASVDGVQHRQTYEYPTNTVVRGSPGQLQDIVVDDTFTAEVTVTGSLTYDTSIGGRTTVPTLSVDTITRTGG